MTVDEWDPPNLDELPSDLLRQAVQNQQEISQYRMIIGFLSNAWTKLHWKISE